MAGHLQQPGFLAFPLQRADARSLGERTRAHLLRTLLERFRCRQDALDSGSGPKSLRGSLRATGTHARRLGLLRFVPEGGEGFRPTLTDPADDAGPGDRRREGIGRSAWATDEAGGFECGDCHPEGHWTLGARGKPSGDDRRAGQVSVTFTGNAYRKSIYGN